MNIACDARSLVGFHTGVSTWVAQVMGGLARHHGHAVTLAASKPIHLPDGLDEDTIRVLEPPRPSIPGTLWLQALLPARLRQSAADVFVGALAVVPRRCPVPAVAMVHDITPRTHPLHHTLANRFCFNAYLEGSLDRAEVVVAGSTATERELLSAYPFIRSKLARIGYGVDDHFSPAGPDEDGGTDRTRLTSGHRYLLHLGTLEPRKGVVDLVAAWERLHQLDAEPPDLVLAGGLGWGVTSLVARIDASPYRDRIHLPGYVDRDTARELMRHAEAFVIASHAEGFGLPLAEALSCGAPCVATDIPSLREAGGDAALYAPPNNPTELADTLVRALQPETAERLRRLAVRRARELRWGPVVAAWNDLLETVIAEGRSGGA